MAAKRRPAPDLIGSFYAKARRDEFARQGIDLAKAGKIREAKTAQKQAEHWDREAKRLSPGGGGYNWPMCYSALVRQDFHLMARRYGLEIAFDMFADLFRRRREGEDIKVSRALERNFAEPSTPVERQIKVDIDAYQAQQVSKWEKDLFVQKKRLADAERSLQTKETKKARKDGTECGCTDLDRALSGQRRLWDHP